MYTSPMEDITFNLKHSGYWFKMEKPIKLSINVIPVCICVHKWVKWTSINMLKYVKTPI